MITIVFKIWSAQTIKIYNNIKFNKRISDELEDKILLKSFKSKIYQPTNLFSFYYSELFMS